MKYCVKCGKELADEAVVCIGCGCLAQNVPNKNIDSSIFRAFVSENEEARESSGLATASLILAFFVPVAGTITGIIGAAKYKNETYKSRCGWAIALSFIVPIVTAFIIYGLMMQY